MKNLIIIVLLGVIALPGLLVEELALGSALPMANRKMPEISGEELSLKDITGKEGLLVIFSSNTCPWVIAWQDRYVILADKYKSKDLGIVAVNSNAAYRGKGDSLEDMQKHAKKNDYNFYYVLDQDSELAQVFGATRTPHSFLFDKTGKLVYRGAIDDNAQKPSQVEQNYLADAIAAMLAGKPIKLTATKAFGCSIKFANKN